MPARKEWETIVSTGCGDPSLQRIAVPGGWLYRTIFRNEQDDQVAMAFVPKPAVRQTPTDQE